MTNDTTTTGANYDRFLRDTHRPAHARRTAMRNAAFFLPHLAPGRRVLDAGCGPGSITIGIGEVVDGGGRTGEVIGVDVSADAIATAQTAARDASCANAHFHVADVYALPFADGAFDAAFCHALLQHLRDPLAALREMRRVLMPGGVIGVADADFDGNIIAPSDPVLDASLLLMRRLREAAGGNPRVGKHLRSLLHEAGFEDVAASVIADCDGDERAVRRSATFWSGYFWSDALRARAIDLGLATEQEMDAMGEAWQRWGDSPGAFWARFWCQAIGRRAG